MVKTYSYANQSMSPPIATDPTQQNTKYYPYRLTNTTPDTTKSGPKKIHPLNNCFPWEKLLRVFYILNVKLSHEEYILNR